MYLVGGKKKLYEFYRERIELDIDKREILIEHRSSSPYHSITE